MITRASKIWLLCPIVGVGLACTPAPGTQPKDMSAVQHEHAAAQEDKKAEQEQVAASEPHPPKEHNVVSSEPDRQRCSPGQRICWGDVLDDTPEHKKRAEQHRKLATQHRQASEALRDAEARACGGISEEDRDMSPFLHDVDIASVSELKEEQATGKGNQPTRAVGATIVVKAVPGLTAEWLQRIVDCHLARNQALGNQVPEMEGCPLVPKGATAKVRSVGNGFAVDVRGADKQSAQEIWRRAQGLTNTTRTQTAQK